MNTIKTVLPAQINTIEEAKKYLTDLFNNGEAYHPEDYSIDCLDIDIETSERMDTLMLQIYELSKGTDFDPCGFLLQLDPEYKFEE